MKKEKKSINGIYVAVFNSHDEDVDKAAAILDIRYGAGTYRKHVKRFVTKGIMSIFDEKPNTQRIYFVLVAAELACARHNWTLKTSKFPFEIEQPEQV